MFCTFQVDWLEAALAIAPEEEKGRIGRELEKAVMEHDRILLTGGLGQTTDDAPDGLPEVPVFTRYKQPALDIFFCLIDLLRQAPILGGTSEEYKESLERQKAEVSILKKGGDLRSEEEDEVKSNKFLTKSFLRAWYFEQNRTIALCNEKADTSSSSFHTSTQLHYGDPYLRMGPFKYELLSSSPHIAIFRDFFSSAECDSFIQRARDNLHSTPYQVFLEVTNRST